MKAIIKKTLLLIVIVASITSCASSKSKSDETKYDLLTIGVSDVAKRYIDNYTSLQPDSVYTGDDAKVLSDIVTTYPPNNTRRTYKTSLTYAEVIADLSELDLPTDLVDSATDGITGYYYLTGNYYYWTIFIEDISNNSIFLYLRGSGSTVSSQNAVNY